MGISVLFITITLPNCALTVKPIRRHIAYKDVSVQEDNSTAHFSRNAYSLLVSS